jgi:methanogenic corrinoid protein MtbC1
MGAAHDAGDQLMQQSLVRPAHLEQFVGHLERQDRKGATRQALGLLGAGATVEDLVLDLLGPAQVEVGRRWETNQWDVADEHAATAITDAVLGALAWHIDTAEARGPVVVTCAEGEWHALPARMAAELLRLHGWQVRFLGASIPADQLRRFLAKVGPVGVAVSCSVPIHLGGAQRSIQAAQAAGVPVLAAGRAFGPDDLRARRLGAQAWAPDAATAARLLAAWDRQPGPVGERPPPAGDTEPLELEACSDRLIGTALHELGRRRPAIAHASRQELTRTRDAVALTLQFLAAALLTGDRRIFLDEFLPWHVRVLASRGLPADVVAGSLEALERSLDALPRSQELLRQGRQISEGFGAG